MKRISKLLLATLLLLAYLPQEAFACNGCSGNLTNFNPELLSNNGSHSIGINYNYNLFRYQLWTTTRSTHIHSDGSEHIHEALGKANFREVLSSYELRSTFYATDRLFFNVVLPVSHNLLYQDGEQIENTFGLGDATVVVNYLLWRENEKLMKKKIQERLSLGGGIKAPTGLTGIESYDGIIEPHHQPGSGSWDFLFMANYFLQVKKVGLTSNISYLVTTENADGFKFANSFNANLRAFYVHEFEKISLMPSIGWFNEVAGEDRQDGEPYFLDTGGKVMFGSVGLDVYIKNFNISTNYLHPFWHQLNGVQLEPASRFQIGMKYAFKRKKDVKEVKDFNEVSAS